MAIVSSSNGLEKYPKLRCRGFSEPWNAIRFGDIVDEYSDRTKEEDEDILLSAAIEGMFLNSELFDHQRGASNKGYKKIDMGTLVLSTQNLHLGNANVNLRFEHGMVSPAYKTYHIHDCSIGLIAEWVKSEKAKRFFYDATTVGASVCRRNVEWDTLYDQPLYLPSEAEQERLAAFLTALSTRIKKQQKLVEHLKKYKRGLLSSLLDKEEWQTVLMQDVASGFDYGMNSAATEYDGKHKYIRITDIDESTHKYISTECVSPSDLPEAKYKVEENDILFARTGASVGKSYIYDSRDGELYYAGFLIRASVKPDFNSYFVYLNTLTLGYQRWVVLESTRSGQPGINAEQYRNYKFKCPPIEIQNKIANIFIHFDLKLQREQEILDYLLNYKKAMMQNIFV